MNMLANDNFAKLHEFGRNCLRTVQFLLVDLLGPMSEPRSKDRTTVQERLKQAKALRLRLAAKLSIPASSGRKGRS